MRRAGLPPIRLHDLRHGYTTHLARAGVPVQITLDLDTHPGLADQEGAVAALDGALVGDGGAEPEAVGGDP